MRTRRLMVAALLFGCAVEARAQQVGEGEIMVTATRRQSDSYIESQPATGLKRAADFAVQPVLVTGDTRDPQKRRDEIFATVRSAIERAAKSGVQLAIGDELLEPLTLENYRSITATKDNRPDSERVAFLVKAPLGPGTDAKAALDRITAFIKAVPVSGRAEITEDGDLTLSIVRPDQYRTQVIELIAADAKAAAARFGSDYRVEVRGLERPVEWARASLGEVILYIPVAYNIVPARP